MKKICLTGNIGCGKSTVARMFGELGAYVFDADEIIRGFYSKGHPVYEKVVETFGEGILNDDGSINRQALADLVFSDEEKLRTLEDITHNALYEHLEREFSHLPEDAVAVVEASLIVEKGTYKNYDKVVVVYADYDTCKKRAIKRGMKEEDFERRWNKQMPIEEKVKYADFVIDNRGDMENTRRQVIEVYETIRRDP